MALSLDEIKLAQDILAKAAKLAAESEAKPAIDTSKIVGGIDAAIVGLTAAVNALTAVKAMLTNLNTVDTKVETAVDVHLPDVVPEPVTPAPASIEAAAKEAEAPKKSKWGWLKKAAPWLLTGGVAVATGGAGALVPVALEAVRSIAGDAGTLGAAVAIGGAALEAGKALVKDKKE